LPLPAALRWVEVDSAELLAHKQALLSHAAPACVLERVALDLADGSARRELFARLGAEGRRTLVITEGLIIYLAAEQVAELAADMHGQRTFACWLTECVSPRQLRRQQRQWGRQLGPASAPMRFGPTEGPAFFHPHGWEPREVRSLLPEARRLGREVAPPVRWLLRLLLDHGPARERKQLRELVRYLLLTRDDRGAAP
jgi:O-methyltransferase involved in polyketide biosynthesis